MLQLLPQNNNVVTPEFLTASEVISFINDYIKKYHCEEISINISFMNILDACHITTICSTTHFIKYPNGKINWIISSELVEELNKDLGLGNCNYTL